MSWLPKNAALSAQPKVTQSADCYHSSMMSHRSTYHHRARWLTDHHVVGTKRQLKPNTSPPRLISKAEVNQLTVIHMTFDMA